MNTRLLGLGALAVAAASLQAAHAAPLTDLYLQRLDAAAEERLDASGVALNGATVAIKGHVGGDGRLSAGRIVRSSGSRDLDDAARQALRGLRIGGPPTELAGRTVTLTLGDEAVDLAGAQ
jgi:TonB family protein